MTTHVVTAEYELRKVSSLVKNIKEGGAVARKLHRSFEALGKRAIRRTRKTYGKVPALTPVGLSAPQIDIKKRVCLLKPRNRPIVLMNPVIVEHSEVKLQAEEHCLSLPGKVSKTYRYNWIVVDTLNMGTQVFGPKGDNVQDIGFAIFMSVVAQHEIAHLYGKLMTDFEEEDYPPPGEWEHAHSFIRRD